ncbi:MAG: carbon monoxide dehydrogenase [Gammaproteobacteria bacterium]|nr:carbon monoxide dehydrogenase [Gammaproteobacteria bacterium]
MKPAPLALAQPEVLDEALTVLAEVGGDARVLAGGQSLIAMLNMRLLAPKVLVDINHLPTLKTIDERKDSLSVGAAVTQERLLHWTNLSSATPLLAHALPFVGHYQTRSRGTVCGSLVHADPSAELPLVLALLDGEMELASLRGRRRLKAGAFQTGTMSTALHDDEMVLAAHFPKAVPGAVYRFDEVSERHGDFALAAFAVQAGAHTTRLGIGGAAATPQVFELPTRDAELAARLNDIAWQLECSSDIHASVRYRRELVRRVGQRVIEDAWHALS